MSTFVRRATCPARVVTDNIGMVPLASFYRVFRPGFPRFSWHDDIVYYRERARSFWLGGGRRGSLVYEVCLYRLVVLIFQVLLWMGLFRVIMGGLISRLPPASAFLLESFSPVRRSTWSNYFRQFFGRRVQFQYFTYPGTWNIPCVD